MEAQIKDIADVSYNGDTVEFTVVLDSLYRQDVYNVVNAFSGDNTPYVLTIEKQKKKRSLNANAYCWVLCQKIAEKVGATKEVVYRKNIREVGSWDVLEMTYQAAARFIVRWDSNGLGWFAEPLGETKKGYVNIIAYYGSSVYSTAEMARLIDSLITEAKGLGLETLPPEEIERLKTAWKG